MKMGAVIGMLVGFGALGLAFIMEGGSIVGLINPSAAIIVYGGTLGATIASFPMQQVLKLPQFFKKALSDKQQDPHTLVGLFVSLAMKARREGLLSLEDEAEKLEDPFLKKGVLLVVDGTDPETIRSILENDISAIGSRHEACYGMLETMGGFSPTMGIIGTVMGLISVLSNMEDPGSIGPSIAVAFIATLYGVATANLVWLPLGNNLKGKSKAELYVREVMLEGLLSVMAGDNPHVVQQKIEAFIPTMSRGKDAKEQGQAQGQAQVEESIASSAAS